MNLVSKKSYEVYFRLPRGYYPLEFCREARAVNRTPFASEEYV